MSSYSDRQLVITYDVECAECGYAPLCAHGKPHQLVAEYDLQPDEDPFNMPLYQVFDPIDDMDADEFCPVCDGELMYTIAIASVEDNVLTEEPQGEIN